MPPTRRHPPIGPVDLPLESGKNYTAVAHLTEAGEPTATLFTNDISQTAPGEGRLTVRHVAAAPAVDVLAGGAPVITNLTNPNEQILNLPAGVVSASVAAAGTTDPVIGPADVDVAEGVNTIATRGGAWRMTTSPSPCRPSADSTRRPTACRQAWPASRRPTRRIPARGRA